MDAESWFYFQDYKNSLPLYQRVHQQLPDHDNVSFKIGFCYLNLEGQKHKAIPYLKKASENTTFNFSREAFYQRKAPVDAIFYLGNAYLVDNQIDKALEAYKRFKKKVEGKRGLLVNSRDFNFEYLEKQMEACRRAREMMNEPVSFTASNIGTPINTPLAEYNPVITEDGKTMVFTAEKKFYTGVFMSKKKNGSWGAPINLLPQLGIDGDCETTSISPNGRELYLYREDDLDGNLYVSHYRNGSWSNIQPLGENINTEYWESHAFISHDTSKLYFTSNRPGGYGDLDIYVAERQSDGTWGEPTNLGPTINTPWREDTPFLTKDGKRLFFSSEGHHSMGGFDVMVSQRTPQGWTEPRNLGYPINTTDHDRFFLPVDNGQRAYYAQHHRQPPGGKDIFQYRIDLEEMMDYIDVQGIMTYDNPEDRNKQDFQVRLIDKRTLDTLMTLHPDNPSGRYDYKLNREKDHLIMETPQLPGNQQLMISQKIDIEERFLVPRDLQATVDTALKEPDPAISLDDQVIAASPGRENVKIKLYLEGGKKLNVKTFRNDSLINTETFEVDKGEFTYHYQPGRKKTRLTFELINDQGKTHTKTVDILGRGLATTERAGEKDTSGIQDTARLKIREQSLSFAGGKKKVRINLEMDEGSKLIVSTYVDNELVSQEEFDIEEEDFTYEFEPRKGKSRINFKVIDPQKRVTSKEVVMSHEPVNPQLEELLSALERYRPEEIENQLSGVENQKMTASEFFSRLYDDPDLDIDAGDLDALMYSLILLDDTDAVGLHQSLKELAGGLLKDYLDSMPADSLTTKKALLQKLRAAAGDPSYTQGELRELLMEHLDRSYEPEKLYRTALKIARLNADTVFKKLGADAIDMVTIQDMMDLLRESDHPDKMEIMAMLRGIEISDEKPGSDKQLALKAKEDKSGTEDRRSPIILLFAGVAILVFLVLMYRRRKKKRSNKN